MNLVGMVYNELPVLAMVLVLGTTLPSLDGTASPPHSGWWRRGPTWRRSQP